MARQGNDTASPRRGSVLRRFNLTLVSLYVLSIALTAPTVWYFTRQQVYEEAHKELTLLVDMVKSLQGYVAADLRPYFMKHKLFYSRGLSGIVATSRVAEQFRKFQPTYYIKNASDNPMNPANMTEPLEQTLLDRFRGNRALDALIETGDLQGRKYLVASAPKVSVPGCMRCHGDPMKAPEELIKEYGTTKGFNYIPKDVVGVSVVGVPLADVNAIATQRGLMAIALLTGLFAVIFIAVNLLVRRHLLSPILEITESARALSQGAIDQPINSARNDEVGELARSFELVRRSLVTAMRHLGSR